MHKNPASVTLRPAAAADAAAIRRLIWAVNINPTGLSWKRFLVAVDEGGSLVGCGQIKPHPDGRRAVGTRELASIAVEPAWRKQGIASRIILRLLSENPPPIYLTCRESLESFYMKFGFRSLTQAEMPPYFLRVSRLVDYWMRVSRISERLRVMLYTGQPPA